MSPDTGITSRSSAWFKRFRAAVELHREEIAVEGPKHVADCLAAGWSPIAIAVRTGVSFAVPPGAKLLTMSESLFRSVSDTVHAQGVLALFPRPTTRASELLSRPGVTVVLDGIQDPGNVGSIVRLAAAFGAAGLVATEGTADPFSPKAIRASAGTALGLPIARCERNELLSLAARNETPIYAAAADGGELPSPLPPSFTLVLGSEGQGISPEIAARSRSVGIEMTGRIESLNVAAAAAILLWQIQEARRGEARS